MCGRYVQISTVQQLKRALGLPGFDKDGGNKAEHYNITPRMFPWIAYYDERENFQKTQLGNAQWGLLPSWAKDSKAVTRPINARAETVFQNAMFRGVIQRRRCLVAADGWYEWREAAGKKTPYYFSLVDGGPFFFGGIWDQWRPAGDGESVSSFAIITTAANSAVAPIHARMPLIIPAGAYDRWLDSRITARADVEMMLLPYPAELLQVRRVSQAVNNPKNNGPDLIRPVRDED